MRRLPDDAHGRTLWLHHGCRCSTCHQAVLDYAQTRRAVRAVLDGKEPQTRVDARPARRHVRRLLAAGWSLRRVALAAHVAPSTVHELVDGRRTLSMAVDCRIRAVPC